MIVAAPAAPAHLLSMCGTLLCQWQLRFRHIFRFFRVKDMGGEYWASLGVGKFAWFNPLRRGHLRSTLKLGRSW